MTDTTIARIMDALTFLALCAFVACSATVDAQTSDPTQQAIAAAVQGVVTAPNGDPRTWCAHVGQRGSGTPWERCSTYVDALAAAFVESGRRHSVDPWVLAGIAYVESRFNPGAVGSDGELGVAQHHPRWFRDLQMVRLGLAGCRARADMCQGDTIDRMARSLARRMRVCRDLRRAVSGHNAGRCSTTPKARRYARRVFARRAELMRGAS